MFLGTGLAKAGQRMAGLIPLLSASREGQQFISCQARGSEKDSLFPPGLSSCFWQRQILALLRCHPCPLGVPRHVTTLGSGPAEMSIGHSAQPSGPLGGFPLPEGDSGSLPAGKACWAGTLQATLGDMSLQRLALGHWECQF